VASIACFVIVTWYDIPIYEAEVGSTPKVWLLHHTLIIVLVLCLLRFLFVTYQAALVHGLPYPEIVLNHFFPPNILCVLSDAWLSFHWLFCLIILVMLSWSACINVVCFTMTFVCWSLWPYSLLPPAERRISLSASVHFARRIGCCSGPWMDFKCNVSGYCFLLPRVLHI
jgi:hypothetical protein